MQLRDRAHTPGQLPDALVRYALRTQETMLLDDASSLKAHFLAFLTSCSVAPLPFLSPIDHCHIAKSPFAAFPTLRLAFHTCSPG